MPDYDFQVIFRHASGLPKDDFVNVLHFGLDAIATDTVEGTADGINTAYSNMVGFYSNAIVGMTIKAYQGGGAPELSKDYPSFNPSGEAAPAEVAVCLSYYADDQSNTNAKRRGRIYIGPFGTVTGELVDGGKRAAIGQLGEAFASIGTASQTTWMMKSSLGYLKIERIAVDDAWDTQRRRGRDATGRQFTDVQ